jgi:hypothetical protein
VRRRPAQPSGALPPERLRRFVASEWSVLPFKEHTTDWEMEQWRCSVSFMPGVMSAECGQRHGDVLGNFVERLKFERAVRWAHVTVMHY